MIAVTIDRMQEYKDVGEFYEIILDKLNEAC